VNGRRVSKHNKIPNNIKEIISYTLYQMLHEIERHFCKLNNW
jgi:hypothetical protein